MQQSRIIFGTKEVPVTLLLSLSPDFSPRKWWAQLHIHSVSIWLKHVDSSKIFYGWYFITEEGSSMPLECWGLNQMDFEYLPSNSPFKMFFKWTCCQFQLTHSKVPDMLDVSANCYTVNKLTTCARAALAHAHYPNASCDYYMRPVATLPFCTSCSRGCKFS